LDLDQTVDALGIYYAQTAGNRQALLEYTLTKRMQPAYMAQSAIWSAFLARRGVTGAEHAIEGKAGFFPVYVGKDAPEPEVFTGPEERYSVETVWIKQFSACGGTHRSTQAAIELAVEADLQPDEIAEVDLSVGENGVWFVGSPFELRRHPQVDAQFSVRHAVALGLVRRAAGPEQYKTENLVSDTVVLDLAKQVRLHEIEGTKGLDTNEVPVTLKVTTKDGRELSKTVLELKGSPSNPMTYDEVADKFRVCATYAGHWSDEWTEEMISTVASIEDLPNVTEFVKERLVKDG
jgi:2-methylcitrate dehydratase PrpD